MKNKNNKSNIYPKNIIAWILLLLPFSVIAILNTLFFQIYLFLVVTLIIIAIYDIFVLMKSSSQIKLSAPEIIRFPLDKENVIRLSIENLSKANIEINILPLLPLEFKRDRSSEKVITGNSDCFQIEFGLCPTRRGIFYLNSCFVEFSSPFKLWNSKKEYQLDCEIRVYPNLYDNYKKLSSIFNNQITNGIHRQRMIGQGREFERLREYVSGDSYDSISWKATAKNAKLISKVFQVERTKEIYVIIDSSRLSGRVEDDKPVLENYLNSTLMLASITEQQGDSFGLLIFNDKVNKFIKAKSGKAHFSACREAIFDCQPACKAPNFDALFSFLKCNIRHRALLFFLTDLDDPSIAEEFITSASIISKQHLCQVCIIKNSSVCPIFEKGTVENNDEIYEKLAGHITWTDISKLKGKLHQKNIQLSMANSDNFSVELINNYLNIKQRQII